MDHSVSLRRIFLTQNLIVNGINIFFSAALCGRWLSESAPVSRNSLSSLSVIHFVHRLFANSFINSVALYPFNWYKFCIIILPSSSKTTFTNTAVTSATTVERQHILGDTHVHVFVQSLWKWQGNSNAMSECCRSQTIKCQRTIAHAIIVWAWSISNSGARGRILTNHNRPFIAVSRMLYRKQRTTKQIQGGSWCKSSNFCTPKMARNYHYILQ